MYQGSVQKAMSYITYHQSVAVAGLQVEGELFLRELERELKSQGLVPVRVSVLHLSDSVGWLSYLAASKLKRADAQDVARALEDLDGVTPDTQPWDDAAERGLVFVIPDIDQVLDLPMDNQREIWNALARLVTYVPFVVSYSPRWTLRFMPGGENFFGKVAKVRFRTSIAEAEDYLQFRGLSPEQREGVIALFGLHAPLLRRAANHVKQHGDVVADVHNDPRVQEYYLWAVHEAWATQLGCPACGHCRELAALAINPDHKVDNWDVTCLMDLGFLDDNGRPHPAALSFLKALWGMIDPRPVLRVEEPEPELKKGKQSRLKVAFWQAAGVLAFLMAGGMVFDTIFISGEFPLGTICGLAVGLILGVASMCVTATEAYKESPCLRYLAVAGVAMGSLSAIPGLLVGFIIEHSVVQACLDMYTWPWVTISSTAVFWLVGGLLFARQLKRNVR